ncbi:MAG: ribulose-phosphate 3-epimerase [Candidatus Omnitrophica bacterium]|nr:ribulose-phosphate 3-epimerase [Candidatus Omnitrophota bacterium]
MKRVLIAPSILSADFGRLAEEIGMIERAGADWVHIDVMDGMFVPNITIGPVVVRSIRKTTKLVFDVHLMIEDPGRYVGDFADAGSDLITFHIEACKDPVSIIGKIRDKKKRAGISIKPGTDISRLKGLLDKVDMVLIMTVEPGFAGQAFMEDMMDKISTVRKNYSGLIQVDGGINAETAKTAISAGADVLVAGSYVFGTKDYGAAIRKVRGDFT